MKTRSQAAAATLDAFAPATPPARVASRKRGAPEPAGPRLTGPSGLPHDTLRVIIGMLDAASASSLRATCKELKGLTDDHPLWTHLLLSHCVAVDDAPLPPPHPHPHQAYDADGAPLPPPPPPPPLATTLAPAATPPSVDPADASLLLAAAARAGSARALLASKVASDARSHPWRLATPPESAAAAAALAAALAPGPSALVVLVDTSGSVAPDDYAAGVAFAAEAAAAAARGTAAGGGCVTGVVQFSGGARVELALDAVPPAAVAATLASLERLNGGTDAAAALRLAGRLLAEWSDGVLAAARAAGPARASLPSPRCAVLLLSDGAFSAGGGGGGPGGRDEVAAAAAELARAGVVFAAGASGRSYDGGAHGGGLRKVVAAVRAAGGEALYVGLRTVDERRAPPGHGAF